MNKFRSHGLRITLYSIIILVLALTSSCFGKPSPPTAAFTQYPAQITSNVIIPKFLETPYFTDASVASKTGWTYWIVNVTFTNKGYKDPEIKSYYLWTLMGDNEIYVVPDGIKSEKLSLVTVPAGQSGETILCFHVPNSLKISNARLKYENQGVASYGTLTGGELVSGYDWGSKTIVNSLPAS